MTALSANLAARHGEPDIAQAMALSARSVRPRLAFAAMFALASAMVLPWLAVAAWLIAVTCWELLGRPLGDRILMRRGGAPAIREYAVIKAASAALFATLGTLLLASGEPLGMVIGTAWLTGSICHTFVYYGSSRTILAVTMAAPCTCALVGAVLGFGLSFEAMIATAAVLSSLSAGAIFLVDRKALMAELERERLALEVAQESSRSKSAFLATMSHELRTPLNAIIGYSELMQETASEQGRGDDVSDHNRVLRASRHLLNMINEILDLSKIEAGRVELEPSGIEVRRLAGEALDAVRPLAAARGNQLRLELAEGIGAVRNDAFRLHQCLVNLLGNAAKFTHDGIITLRARRDGDLLMFEVEDTGVGIAPDKMDKLFQPFVQADASTTRVFGGTGLGLVICRRLAQLMGGDVTARSVLGEGATFTLTVAAHLTVRNAEERELSTAASLPAQAA